MASNIPDKNEIISIVLALEEVARPDNPLGRKGLQYMCLQGARMIRLLRPDLAFVEKEGAG